MTISSRSSAAVIGSLRIPEVVNDQQWDGSQRFHELPWRVPPCDCLRPGHSSNTWGFSIQHTIALLGSPHVRWPAPGGLLPVPAGAEEAMHLPAFRWKAQVARSKTRLRFIFGFKTEVEIIQIPLRGRGKAACLPPAVSSKRSTAPGQLVRDQARDQIDGSHGFGLSLAQSGFEYGGPCLPDEVALIARCSSMRFIPCSPELVLLSIEVANKA